MSPGTSPESISVITPSYQYEHFLPTCIRSVREQSSPWPVQHVVVDDASTDTSADIIRREIPAENALVHNENQGLSRTLNQALAMATGDVICWLNSDDFHLPWAYRQVTRAFERHPEAGIVFGDTAFVDDDSRLTRLVPQPAFDRRVMEGGFNSFHVPSVFFRRTALPADWTFDDSMLLYMDLDLWLAITSAPTVVVKVDAVLSAFRRHEAQVSATVRPSDALEVQRLAGRYDLAALRSRESGGWTRAAHARHALGKVLDGGAMRQISARWLRGRDLDWTNGAVLPPALAPPAAPRLRATTTAMRS